MDGIQGEAKGRFLRIFSSASSECDVLEIRGSGSNIIDSEKVMPMEQVSKYLRRQEDKPVFKLVKHQVGEYFLTHQPSPPLSWIPEVISELGLDQHIMTILSLAYQMFHVSEQVVRDEKLLVMYAYINRMRLIAVHNEAKSSTTCIILVHCAGVGPKEECEYIFRFLKQNKELFQSPYFVQLSHLAVRMDAALGCVDTPGWPDWYRLDEDNRREWETTRKAIRLAQQDLNLCRNNAHCLRKQLDDGRDTRGLHKDVIAGNAGVRKAFDIMESWMDSIVQAIELELTMADDFMARLSREMMRQDTDTSLKMAKLSVELAKAAKADSSSMKVIAVMTMVFLPGTFFTTLFAVPSLDWEDGERVVGGRFWVYWAFTAPSTVLIILLWLVTTQRTQMRSLAEAGKEQWSAQVQRYRAKKIQTPARLGLVG